MWEIHFPRADGKTIMTGAYVAIRRSEPRKRTGLSSLESHARCRPTGESGAVERAARETETETHETGEALVRHSGPSGANAEGHKMPIEFTCPNGHKLKVKESSAGKTGHCPVCNTLVRVPRPPAEELSEDAILGFLGRHDPGKSPKQETSAHVAAGSLAPPKKSCMKCHREIDGETHICPYCHTYVARLADF